MKRGGDSNGFTIVELLVVIVVIGILAVITIISFNGVQAKAKTATSLSASNQIEQKASIWNTLLGSYPDLAQLRTNSLNPSNIDTPGGDDGPIEAKLSSPDIAIGAEIDQVRANNGNTVYYAPCWDGSKHAGATVAYWDFSTNEAVEITIGSCL